MEKFTQIEQLLLRSRRLVWALIAVTLVILAATILLAGLQLRASIREQIAGRDAEVLHAVAMMQLESDAPNLELLGPITDPANQLSVVLRASRLPQTNGVLAIRLFDASGRFVESFPFDVRETTLEPQSLATLASLKPVSHFHAAVPETGLFLNPTDPSAPGPKSFPLLEVNVPLHTRVHPRLIGIAQFNVEGSSIAAEFARLDRHLVFQGLTAFCSGGVILVLAIGWALARLRHAHDLLGERTGRLLLANQELALAAKTSAVGAITSHLIHGLKNPLSGLQHFMSSLAPADSDSAEADWQQAIAATRRMHSLIHQVVNVLREEETAAQYELSLADLAEIVASKVRPLLDETGVRFVSRSSGAVALPNRTANLVALVLANLAHNAIQATPKGKTVVLSIVESGSGLVCEIQDEGTGLPPNVAAALFTPCKSTKAGGSGIGLAISKQLANHLGGGLELKRSGPDGCLFVLTVPLEVATAKKERPASPVSR